MDVQIERLSLKSGGTIELSEGVTILVGPNNAGKSALMREMMNCLATTPGHTPGPFKVLASIELAFEPDRQLALENLKREFVYRIPGQDTSDTFGQPVFALPNGSTLPESQAAHIWAEKTTLGVLASSFALHFAAETRANLTYPAQQFNVLTEHPTQPLQRLYLDRTLEENLSNLVRNAFGEPITVNRYAGQTIHLHLGKPGSSETAPPPSSDYLKELASLPIIHEQGDGLKSFVGLVLHILAGREHLLLIDEPEAFLHPPQERTLGTALAQLVKNGRKVVVATHSSNLVQGIVSEATRGGAGVSIHRIQRHNDTNNVANVSAELIQRISSDPLMRQSSLLEGIFYHGVLVCESEGDCLYYSSVMELLPNAEEARVDLHITHCSGKARIPRAIEAMRAARTPAASVVDIDILQGRHEIADLISAHQGDPSKFEARLNTVAAAVESKSTRAKRSNFAAIAGEVLDHSEKHLSNSELTSIRESITSSSGWKLLKQSGVAALRGQARIALLSIIDDLRVLGIFVVPCGELEGFHPDVPSGDKAHWLRTVIETEVYKDEGEQHDFVRSIREYFRAAQASTVSPALGADATA